MSLIAARIRSARRPFLYVLVLYVVALIIWQHQWSRVDTIVDGLLWLALAGGITIGLSLYSPQTFLPVFAYLAWYAAAGSAYLWRDLLVLLVFCAAGTRHYASQTGKRLWGTGRSSDFAFGGVLTVVIWIAISSVDRLAVDSPLPHDPQRLAGLRERSPYKNRQIGLALSGGGYRAALMHAGVLDGLERMGVVPTHLSSVSGGSIISSFYTIGGSPTDFLQAVYEHRFNLARSVTNFYNAVHLACPLEVPVLQVRLLPFCEFGRSDVQAQNLDSVLLGGIRISDLNDPNLPSLLICLTDLHTGASLAIGNRGVTLVGPGGTLNQFPFANLASQEQREIYFELADSKEPLARVVAASGAFPGALSPMILKHGDRDVHVIDGGVLDNSGMNLLLAPTLKGPQPEWKLDVAISSDAGAPFELWSAPTNNEEAFIHSLEQLNRAMDILSNNGGVIPELHDQLQQPLLILTPKQMFSREDATRLLRRAEAAAKSDARLKQLLNTWTEELGASRRNQKIVPNAQLEALGSLLRSTDMFRRASTLRDYYPEDEAKQLFQLGRFLVALSWPDLRCHLDGTGASDAGGQPCSASPISGSRSN